MKATAEQFNQLAGEPQSPPLNYPRFMDSAFAQAAAEANRQQRAAERKRKKRRRECQLLNILYAFMLLALIAGMVVCR